jgi:cobyrinic acid a,c-diamide synthase
VILNQVSGARHREKAVQAVEELTGTPVIGVIERRAERLPERHLGLVTLDEEDQTKNSLRHMESMVADVDLDGLLGIAEKAGDVTFPDVSPYPTGDRSGIRVAVPRDRAFCFYYAENLESIQAAGGMISYFQPTDGASLPDADAYYLGGGYPELYGKELETNHDFREGLRTEADNGKLVYGECGGLMTMCRSIRNGEEERAMTGIFPYDAELTDGRQGLAYVKARGTADNFLFPNMDIRGHEFHYSRLTPTPPGPYGFDVLRGTGIDGNHDGLIKNKCIGTYMHQHALANKEWGLGIVQAASR